MPFTSAIDFLIAKKLSKLSLPSYVPIILVKNYTISISVLPDGITHLYYF